MRHGDKIKNLSRKASHRSALLSNLACQLITHKRIVTTLAKAKALRTYVEPLITKSKDNTTHQRRVVFSYLNDSDNAETALIELVDFNEIYGKGKGEAKEATGKRTRRAGSKKKAASPKEETSKEEKTDKIAAE
jgi:large subunit ribosomal protein L17